MAQDRAAVHLGRRGRRAGVHRQWGSHVSGKLTERLDLGRAASERGQVDAPLNTWMYTVTTSV